MSGDIEPEVRCEDLLRNNKHLYAHKAKRKKVALISLEAANNHATAITIELASSTLVTGDRSHAVASPDAIIRKFTEFTWDFLVYSIFSFQPLLAVVDGCLFLTGPLYNRRLRKQLRLLSDGDLVLGPGETRKAILGFPGVAKAPTELRVMYRCDGGERRQIACALPAAGTSKPA